MLNRVLCKCQECLLRNRSGPRIVSSAFLDHQRNEKFKASIVAIEREYAILNNEAIDQILDEDQEIQMQAIAQNTSTEVGQNMPETLADDIAMNVEDDMIMGQDLSDALLDEEDENDNDVGEVEEEEEDDHANEGGAYIDRDPFVPNHPAAFILFILIVLFYRRYVSGHALEMMMFAFNMVLKVLGIPYTFPSRVQPLKSWIKRQSDVYGGMREYVMCSTCSSIYPYQTQEEKERMQRHTHCVFKDTLQTSHKCRTPLFQSLDVTIVSESTASRKKYIPVKRFYFNSVIHTLKSFFRRRMFANMLDESFERNVSGFDRPANYTCNVQHGSVYQEFKLNGNEDTIPFTKEDPFNLLLLLNMHHFEPHQYSSYSVGGVWLSILNLSHEERLLRKNTVLSSILPGPREVTQMEMARLLKPLVDELNILKHGVIIQDFSGREITVKACLVLMSADLPAIRKLMGVVAHNGICSCAFCDIQFSSLDKNQRDYSNMDIDTYPERTKETHERNSANWLSARTQTDRDKRKKATGTAYSVFQELAHFDCSKLQSVDVLHCSYLGICKRILRTIWLDISCTVETNTRLLSTKDLKEMSQHCGATDVPTDHRCAPLSRSMFSRAH